MFHLTLDVDSLSFGFILLGLLLGLLAHWSMARVRLPEPLPLTAECCRGLVEES